MAAEEGNKKKARRPKNRSNKLNIVFDEGKRREFLTGFHKRKLQRKQYAKDKLEKDLKEERKRLKLEAKESYKKLVVSHRDIPEVDKILGREVEEFEDEEVTVKVVELSPEEIAKENNWIGPNKPKYDEDVEEEEDEEIEDEEEIPGMSLTEKKKPKVEKPKKQFTSSKEIKSTLKKQATKKVQNSKVFKRKTDVERRKQKKRSMREEKERSKFLKKHKKFDKGESVSGKTANKRLKGKRAKHAAKNREK
ncbi:PREDICTED: nucleolar protein 12 [Nicrophorus vespilloides]|uniref:Nucleolar protein 12 n=1 Tax=Nicrophorus vespilloides TaxID=110193 RepID=A0ABM1MAX4_NICVS|nr:PREDICTED: nucleolar protein 12 [Nicrophorus vespilloides]